MKRSVSLLVLGLLAISVYGYLMLFKPVSYPVTAKEPVVLSSDKLWSLVQEWRHSEGLLPYTKDQRLCNIARDRIKAGDDDHGGFYAQFSSSPYELSENSVWHTTDEAGALKSWLKSPRHHEALLRPYKYSCLVTDGNNALQIFSNF